jgi:hypothetical protein
VSDPERELRREAMVMLEPWFLCQEPAAVKILAGFSGEIDILCRPRLDTLHHFSLAIEIKNTEDANAAVLAPWIKQAADYVYANPENGWPTVAASFLWLVGPKLRDDEYGKTRALAMFQLAQHFRVGHIQKDIKIGLRFTFGPSAEIFRERRGGWTPKARELLAAKRVSAGSRRSPVST